MNTQEVKEKLTKIFVEDLEYNAEDITPDATLKEDIGVDSLDMIDIVAAVENNFGFKVDENEMRQVETFDQLCMYIERHVA